MNTAENESPESLKKTVLAVCFASRPARSMRLVGANKLMHSVIEPECTGCELCLPPCPMDCIEMLPAAEMGLRNQAAVGGLRAMPLQTVQERGREERQARLSREDEEKARLASSRNIDRKQAVLDAVQRARAKSG